MGRRLALAALLAGATGWWYSPCSPRVPGVPDPAPGSNACALPPGRDPADGPLQTDVDDRIAPFRFGDGQVRPLAGFRIHARVLAREDYATGREARFSPTDLALGWGRMGDDAVLSRLRITQSGRWYHYRWSGDPPIPRAEIVRSSANMHMVPADATVARALRRVREDDRLLIRGWLVRIETPDGWRWRSSLSREDSGNGACELVYVCAIEVTGTH
ncbi:hypothetical protein L599_001600000430 [Luteimonas sp. J16]|jgi:hypothetical protein|uniref:hypothetical protein n=1 Tax=unclassified Luteimonas TaxID=2629088 RepID=UPI0004B9A37B|nr:MULTISPECIES: hypothetical protein [unclassified Luteimonas]TWG92995.1 hypothetical protein L599_001600000430 [Luteimonas sp. J16]